jgi:hypothetical protein
VDIEREEERQGKRHCSMVEVDRVVVKP